MAIIRENPYAQDWRGVYYTREQIGEDLCEQIEKDGLFNISQIDCFHNDFGHDLQYTSIVPKPMVEDRMVDEMPKSLNMFLAKRLETSRFMKWYFAPRYFTDRYGNKTRINRNEEEFTCTAEYFDTNIFVEVSNDEFRDTLYAELRKVYDVNIVGDLQLIEIKIEKFWYNSKEDCGYSFKKVA